ncbi:MAG TPA: fibronectin type III domain-containing protein [Acidobacteriaceae bacterium]|nr:fibronectin type III domain-containing protein [Acidobacteriaceae bacterium]
MTSKGNAALLSAAAVLLLLAGCASPGAPQPPSLHLPRPVNDLQAQRVGDSVQLRWTMPHDTTDGQELVGQRTVAVCRRMGAGVCEQVQSLPETPAAKVTLEDVLPPAVVKASPELLTYEIEVMSTAGRSTGASDPAYTASGAAPLPVNGLQSAVTEQGVVLSWQQAPEVSMSAGTEILLRRERLHGATVASAYEKSASQKNPLAPQREPDVQMLRVHADAGGTLDASAVFGEQYAYTVQRVEKLVLAGQSVEIRSEPSETVNVDVRDVFPPQAPQGLAVADPVRGADGSYAIDLSWEANAEPDLAGYFVYRRDAGTQATAVRMNAQPLPAPAFHDASLLTGHTYTYSVTAVDKSGNESKHSAESTEEVPQ